jgi:hypothetical protein
MASAMIALMMVENSVNVMQSPVPAYTTPKFAGIAGNVMSPGRVSEKQVP